jgi:hypothetical protein
MFRFVQAYRSPNPSRTRRLSDVAPAGPVHGQGGQLSWLALPSLPRACCCPLASSEESLDHNTTLQHLLTRTGHTLLAWRRLRPPLLAWALVVCVSACPKVRVMCKVMANRKCPIIAVTSITLTTNEGTTLVTPTTTTTVGVSAEARENSSLVFLVPSSSAVH